MTQLQCQQHRELLRAYVDTGSEQAFAQLVAEYVDLVYSAALRQVHNKSLAEEVTQTVFIILARKASKLRWDTVLSAWLFKTTRYTAMNLLRAEARRQVHERKAAEMASDFLRHDSSWQRLSPMLDQGIARLNERDRSAITLRFFEQRSIAETAEAMGITEQAAAMRVHRAVDKLRAYFRERRADLPTAALGGVLWANSVHAAPHGLAGSVASHAMNVISGAAGSAAAAIATTDAIIRAMAIAKAKAAAFLLGSVLAAALAAGIILDYMLSPLVNRVLTPQTHTTSLDHRGLRDFRIAKLEGLMNLVYKPSHNVFGTL
jgi:RNA polymerase sigma factor (sigma-70 family)